MLVVVVVVVVEIEVEVEFVPTLSKEKRKLVDCQDALYRARVLSRE